MTSTGRMHKRARKPVSGTGHLARTATRSTLMHDAPDRTRSARIGCQTIARYRSTCRGATASQNDLGSLDPCRREDQHDRPFSAHQPIDRSRIQSGSTQSVAGAATLRTNDLRVVPKSFSMNLRKHVGQAIFGDGRGRGIDRCWRIGQTERAPGRHAYVTEVIIRQRATRRSSFTVSGSLSSECC